MPFYLMKVEGKFKIALEYFFLLVGMLNEKSRNLLYSMHTLYALLHFRMNFQIVIKLLLFLANHNIFYLLFKIQY